ncbi:putative nodal modulator 1-like protein, partial [Operophtera brumata]
MENNTEMNKFKKYFKRQWMNMDSAIISCGNDKLRRSNNALEGWNRRLNVKEKKDVTGVLLIAVQPTQLTDSAVLVRARSLDHYRTLRLALALEDTPHSPIYSTKLDPA